MCNLLLFDRPFSSSSKGLNTKTALLLLTPSLTHYIMQCAFHAVGSAPS